MGAAAAYGLVYFIFFLLAYGALVITLRARKVGKQRRADWTRSAVESPESGGVSGLGEAERLPDIDLSGLPVDIEALIATMLGRASGSVQRMRQGDPRVALIESRLRDTQEMLTAYRELPYITESATALLKEGVTACATETAAIYQKVQSAEESELRALSLARSKAIVKPSALDFPQDETPLPLVDEALIHSRNRVGSKRGSVDGKRRRGERVSLRTPPVRQTPDHPPVVPPVINGSAPVGGYALYGNVCVDTIPTGSHVRFISGNAQVRVIEAGCHIESISGNASIYRIDGSVINSISGNAAITRMNDCDVRSISGEASVQAASSGTRFGHIGSSASVSQER